MLMLHHFMSSFTASTVADTNIGELTPVWSPDHICHHDLIRNMLPQGVCDRNNDPPHVDNILGCWLQSADVVLGSLISSTGWKLPGHAPGCLGRL